MLCLEYCACGTERVEQVMSENAGVKKWLAHNRPDQVWPVMPQAQLRYGMRQVSNDCLPRDETLL